MHTSRKNRVLWMKFPLESAVWGDGAQELSMGQDRDSTSAGGIDRLRMAASVGSRSRGRPCNMYWTPSTYEVRSKDEL